MRREHLLWLAVGFEGGLFVLAAALAWLFGLPLRNLVIWDWSHLAWALAATVPPLVALWWMQTSRWTPLRQFRETVDRVVTPLFDNCSWLDFALISLVAGVGEESLFRGVLQYGLDPWLGSVAAVIVAGIAFGLVHWITPMYALYATLMGIYLGWLFVWLDNLLVPMIVHGLYDFVALIYVTADGADPAVQEADSAGHTDATDATSSKNEGG